MNIAPEDFRLLLTIIDTLCNGSTTLYIDPQGTLRCRYCSGQEYGSYDHHSFVHRDYCVVELNKDLQARFPMSNEE